MMALEYLLAVDQGTSGTKTVIFDCQGRIVSKSSVALESHYPRTGFVEQAPQEIYGNVLASLEKCLESFTRDASGDPGELSVCGISNQRETFILWDNSGAPLTNAIVWQCKRSVEICRELRESGLEDEIREKTGLIIDPYFSATKLMWLYRNDEKIRKAIDSGEAYFGTIDTWLIFKLTHGKSYFTDHTNASRTLLFNINTLSWDDSLLSMFGLGNLILPEIKPSSHFFGHTDFNGIFPQKLAIAAVIGDSHAAAFGEMCFEPGMAKATLGTGCSILMNTGEKRIVSRNGMVTTICFSLKDKIYYALEGIIVSCGATMQWLKNQAGLLDDVREAEHAALSVQNNNGVCFIPAFSGLGAPYWHMDAKAMITGLTFGCTRNHIIRAALESIPFQIKDVISAMEEDCGMKLNRLHADGGITSNAFVMQLLADILETDVENLTGIEEVSALGAAFLAGMESGVFSDIVDILDLNLKKKHYTPGLEKISSLNYYELWRTMIKTLF